MANKKLKNYIILLLSIAFCGVLLFYLFDNHITDEISEVANTTRTPNGSQKTAEIDESLTDLEQGLVSQLDNKKEPDLLLNMFYGSNNFYAFVNNNLEKAIEGDRKVQYYLSQALAECEHWVSHPSFQSDESFEKYLNEDNIYLWSRNSKEVLKDTYNSCKNFVGENMNELYGDSSEWLAKALDSQYPPAVIDNNIEKMVKLQFGEYQSLFDSSELSAGTFKISSDALIIQTLDVLELDEPQAFLALAHGPIKLANYSAEETYAAWVMLGCKNGLPCDNKARWLKMACSTESSCYDDSDALNMLKGEFSKSVINRSNELVLKLEEAINNNNWSELTPSLREIDSQIAIIN